MELPQTVGSTTPRVAQDRQGAGIRGIRQQIGVTPCRQWHIVYMRVRASLIAPSPSDGGSSVHHTQDVCEVSEACMVYG